MKIVIEGMDGVGKTILAKKICETFSLQYENKSFKVIFDQYNNPSNLSIDEIKKYEKNICLMKNKTLRALYYGFGNLYAMLEKDNIVIDRGIGANYYWNQTKQNRKLFYIILNEMPKPDLTIILYASLKTRIERMKLRNPNDPDLNRSDVVVDNYKELLHFYKKSKVPYVVINTENKSAEEVFEIAKLEIEKRTNRS